MFCARSAGGVEVDAEEGAVGRSDGGRQQVQRSQVGSEGDKDAVVVGQRGDFRQRGRRTLLGELPNIETKRSALQTGSRLTGKGDMRHHTVDIRLGGQPRWRRFEREGRKLKVVGVNKVSEFAQPGGGEFGEMYQRGLNGKSDAGEGALAGEGDDLTRVGAQGRGENRDSVVLRHVGLLPRE